MSKSPVELMQGTLDLMVLQTLSWGPRHGYAIARWIQQVTDDVLKVEEGSLYPALHRLEERGLIDATWGLSENNRRAKYYQLTSAGRQRLLDDAAIWQRFADAMQKVLRAAAPDGALAGAAHPAAAGSGGARPTGA